jgi:predicted phage terminase large subunit-like protein
VDEIVETARICNPDGFALETNQFQELFEPLIRTAAGRAGVDVPIESIENTIKKQIRIRRVGPHLGKRNFRFRNTPDTRLCVNQLRDFPHGDHDDGPDALEMALRMAVWYFNGKYGPNDGLGRTLV